MNSIQSLDSEQLAAYKADHNVVVSAGAGSGKTTVLSRRYVRLVSEKRLPVEAILTLTFTRKAAAEMFSRIHQELSQLDDPWVQEQLQRFDSARIATLDSFCSSIVRGSCQIYGIPPNFTIDEAKLTQVAKETATAFLMEHQHEAALRELVAIFSFDRVVSELLADFCLYELPVINAPSYEALARNQVDELLHRINNILQRLSDIFAEGARIDTKGQSKGIIAIVELFQNHRNLAATYAETDHEGLLTLCNTIAKIRKPGTVAPGSDSEQVKDLFSEAKDLCPLLQSLLFFYKKRDHIQRLGFLLDDLARRFNQKKRSEAILSFSDLIDLAVDILKSSLPLRNYYKQQIRAIMIDEFQDNNEKQKELLYLLGERENEASPGIPPPDKLAPDKLFFVGDEKQSIYRFRGADVSVFKRLSQELNQAASPDLPRQLSIRTNYRSEPELIKFFNQLFPGIFGNPEEDYEASYTEAKPDPNRPPSGTIPVEIYINTAEEDEENLTAQETESEDTGQEPEAFCSPSETEALTVARRIIEGLERSEFRPGDVALLFRTTTHQSVYERVFRTIGIPFVSADPRGLYLDAPSNDLYAMLQLVIVPQDTNAYAAVLRSPFVNISDQAFLNLMLRIKDDPWFEPFSDLPDSFWVVCDPQDRTRYTLGAELYGTLKTMTDTRGIADLLAWLWYETGYRTSILNDPEMATTVGHFELLYDLAIDADQRHLTLATFLEELAPRIGNPEKIEGDETDKGTDAVTFMTIHKSKGLQFPVVIIPQSGAEGQALRNEKPYYYDESYGPVISWKSYNRNSSDKIINPFFEKLRESEYKQTHAELKRLFYVALTRAEQKIIIAGNRKVSQKALKNFRDEYSQDLSSLEAALYIKPKDDRAKIRFFDLLALGIDQVSKDLFSLQPIEPILLTDRGKALTELRRQLDSIQMVQSGISGSNNEDWQQSFYNPPGISPIVPVNISSRITSPTAMERYWQQMQQSGAPGNEKDGMSSSSAILPKASRQEAPQPLPALAVDQIFSASNQELETIFGTLCHNVIQNSLEDLGDMPSPQILAELEKLNMQDEQKILLINTAKSLAKSFIQSELGQTAVKAKPLLKTEYAFLLPLYQNEPKPILIQGSIDLIFETPSNCFVIDFKTDKVLQSEAHRIQLECYQRAAQAFSDKPVKTLLVYLRNMQVIEVSSRLNDAELYTIAQEAISVC